MVLPSIISVIPPTVCLVLALYISVQGWKDRGIKVFVFLLFALTAYGVVQVIIQNQQDVNDVARLVRFRTAFWGLIAPLSYHTIIALLNEKMKFRMFVLICLYLFGIALIILSLTGCTIYKDYYHGDWGWGSVPDPGNWFFIALFIYLVTGVLALLGTLFSTRQQTENYRIHKLANAILINSIWGGVFTIVPYFILSWFKMPAEIFLAYAGNIAVFLQVFAIQKYHPDKLSAGRLLSGLTPLLPADALMITTEKKISWISLHKLLINGFTCKDLEGADYKKLFTDTSLLDKEMNKLKLNANYSASFETECRTCTGNNIRLNVNMTALRNEFNDVISFLVIFSKQVDDRNHLQYLQTSYQLSVREKEIAALLLNELSNNQICDKLFISLNTVKTHTRSIYQKTNTTNRKEFKDLCRNLALRAGPNDPASTHNSLSKL
jgi:DNA-binding CsgD family transcriptional regulator